MNLRARVLYPAVRFSLKTLLRLRRWTDGKEC